MHSHATDYGELYDSPLFPKLFPDFLELQEEAAEMIWARVLGRCGQDIGMPTLDTVVDLGCGEGTLTHLLAARSARARCELRMIGIDCSERAINKAREKICSGQSVEFLHFPGDGTKVLEWLATVKDIEWERTAVLCLSHTWFHFPQGPILNSIKGVTRPALLVIDVFHTWDKAIELLKTRLEVFEFGRSLAEGNFWLKTEKLPNGSGTTVQVRRGLWRSEGSPANGDWAFVSIQEAVPTVDLLGNPKLDANDPEIFQKARNQGLLTGEEICDYIRRKSFRHPSGWGEMRCDVLVPRDRVAALANRAFYKVVRNIIHRMFITAECDPRFKGVRQLVEFFDETADSNWKRRTGFAGSREAVVVLPFDPYTSFARIVGLFENSDDLEISQHDLILENPSAAQLRFPTAYGMYHTIEDRVSSPQGFPLHWATDYEHTELDKAFEALEATLLGLRSKSGAENDGTSFLVGSAPIYFLVPVFFGSLPLFALALKVPKQFSPEATHMLVYTSMLTNLHDEIKVALTQGFVQNEIISKWIAHVIVEIANSPFEWLRRLSLDEKMSVLERMLWGSPLQNSDLCTKVGPGQFRVNGNIRNGGLLSKDWKSWILSIPSFPIKNLKSVEAENCVLWQLWERERRRTLLDHEMRISLWFQEAEFFGGKAHEKWLQQVHPALLKKLLEIAGASNWDRLAGESLEDNGYLAGSSESYLLRWAVKLLTTLAKDPASNMADAHYQNLKANFCKDRANHGTALRFSWKRLKNVLNAAIANQGSKARIPVLPEQKHPLSANWEIWERCCYVSDPTVALGDIAQCLTEAGFLKEVHIITVEPDTDTTAVGFVEYILKDAFIAGRGGHDFDQLQRAFNAAGIPTEAFNTIFGKSKIQIHLRFERCGQGELPCIRTRLEIL